MLSYLDVKITILCDSSMQTHAIYFVLITLQNYTSIYFKKVKTNLKYI